MRFGLLRQIPVAAFIFFVFPLCAQASFTSVLGVALDSHGYLWVADGDEAYVKKVDMSNDTSVSVFGGGVFGGPNALTFDLQGHLWVVDGDNASVLELDATSGTVIKTLTAGNSLSFPNAVAFDSQGNLYVSDNDNAEIFKIDPETDTILATYSGSGTLGDPTAVAFDPQGHLFVADGFDSAVVEIDMTDDTVIATYTAEDTLSYVTAVAFDAKGDMYVADSNNTDIVKISTTTDTILDSYTGSGMINNPHAIVFDSQGNLYAGDDQYRGVIKISTSTNAVSNIFTGGSWPAYAGFVSFDTQGHMYLMSNGGPEIEEIDPSDDSILNTYSGSQPRLQGGSVAIASPDGRIFAIDGRDNVILEIDKTTDTNLNIFTFGGVIKSPESLAYDPQGNLWVSSGVNKAVYQIDTANNTIVKTITGGGTLTFPTFITFDSSGNLYVMNSFSVVEINPANDSVIRTLNESGVSSYPQSIVVDSQGYLYIADGFDGVFKIDTANNSIVATIISDALEEPCGTAFDALGHLLVSDSQNGNVVEFDTNGTPVKVHVSNILTFPVVITNAATSVTYSSATISGQATNSYGVNAASQSGFIYGTAPDLSVVLGTFPQAGRASFSQTLTSLSPGTTYYYRAFATNSSGTAYGTIESFDTAGEYKASGLLGQSSYTADVVDAPSGSVNPYGFGGLNSLVLDTIYHRLFVSDTNGANNRVLVYQLDDSNHLATTTPSYVLGTCSFTSKGSGAATASTFGFSNLAYDQENSRLFISDNMNNRVLSFDVAPSVIHNCENATFVIGQLTMNSNTSGVTRSRFWGPDDIDYDPKNYRLFVSDERNNRVVAFSVPPGATSSINGENALFVLGQPDFTTKIANLSQNGLNFPAGISYDYKNNRVLVSDYRNARVMVFPVAGDATTSINGENASFVLGQPDFSTKQQQTAQNSLRNPDDNTYDVASDRFYVTDMDNSRVMIWSIPPNAGASSNGMNAQAVIGQGSWTASISGTDQNIFTKPEAPHSYDPVNNILYSYEAYGYRVLEFRMVHITAASVPGGLVNTPYSQPVTISQQQGSAQTFSVIGGSLPPGLSLDSSTGIISGSPTQTGTYYFSVEVDDNFTNAGYFFDRASYSMYISPMPSTGGGGGGGGVSLPISSLGVPGTTTLVATTTASTTRTVAMTAVVPGQPSPIPALPSFIFSKPLSYGSTNAEVTSLQKVLISLGFLKPGLATGYFGALTRAAVGAFQIQKGLVVSKKSYGWGNVGPQTRAALNSLQL